MAFFWKADAKVRQISEPPKLFEEKFSESFYWPAVHNLFPASVCQLIPFLSRKRMQNYCFKTYPPNLCTKFFTLFCRSLANSLICRCVLRQGFSDALQGWFMLHLILLRARVSTLILSRQDNESSFFSTFPTFYTKD